jgi:hypothetical protein
VEGAKTSRAVSSDHAMKRSFRGGKYSIEICALSCRVRTVQVTVVNGPSFVLVVADSVSPHASRTRKIRQGVLPSHFQSICALQIGRGVVPKHSKAEAFPMEVIKLQGISVKAI